MPRLAVFALVVCALAVAAAVVSFAQGSWPRIVWILMAADQRATWRGLCESAKMNRAGPGRCGRSRLRTAWSERVRIGAHGVSEVLEGIAERGWGSGGGEAVAYGFVQQPPGRPDAVSPTVGTIAATSSSASRHARRCSRQSRSRAAAMPRCPTTGPPRCSAERWRKGTAPASSPAVWMAWPWCPSISFGRIHHDHAGS
ncbi:hypothetical protein SRIMM317S_03455 [Streptomyces rimosus subsp. rimosus]